MQKSKEIKLSLPKELVADFETLLFIQGVSPKDLVLGLIRKTLNSNKELIEERRKLMV